MKFFACFFLCISCSLYSHAVQKEIDFSLNSRYTRIRNGSKMNHLFNQQGISIRYKVSPRFFLSLSYDRWNNRNPGLSMPNTVKLNYNLRVLEDLPGMPIAREKFSFYQVGLNHHIHILPYLLLDFDAGLSLANGTNEIIAAVKTNANNLPEILATREENTTYHGVYTGLRLMAFILNRRMGIGPNYHIRYYYPKFTQFEYGINLTYAFRWNRKKKSEK